MANRYLVRATLLLCANFALGCDDDGEGTGTMDSGAADGAGDSGTTDATEDSGTSGTTEDPGATEDTGATGTGGTTTAMTDTGVVPSTGDDIDGCDPIEPFECGAPSVCDRVEFLSEEDDPSSPIALTDPSPAQCVLEALRDDVAAIHVVVNDLNVDGGIPGQFRHTYTLEAFGDGTIVMNFQVQEDKSFDGEVIWAERQPTEFFDACLMETDDIQAVFDCLTGSLDTNACINVPPACPAGG